MLDKGQVAISHNSITAVSPSGVVTVVVQWNQLAQWSAEGLGLGALPPSSWELGILSLSFWPN